MSSKMSVLEMTQNILSAMNSDEINSINDTVESQQVAQVIQETYYELFANEVEPSQQKLIQLVGLVDLTQPNCMAIPDNIVNVDWIRYNGSLVQWMAPEDFLNLSFINNTVPNPGYWIYNDRGPTYYTTFDNNILVFDCYDASSEDTMHASNSLCWAQMDFTFDLEDDFVPALDSNRFPQLLAEAKSVCFLYFKQVSSSKDEARSRRQKVAFQNNRWRAGKETYFSTPDYGRRRGSNTFRPLRPTSLSS